MNFRLFSKNKFIYVVILLGLAILFGMSNRIKFKRPLPNESSSSNLKVVDLGGVIVSIPEGYRNFISYDEGADDLEVGNNESTENTYPRVSSFGFVVMYPDMKDPQPVFGRNIDIFTTKRMRVLVHSGSRSGLDGWLALRKKRLLDPQKPCYMKCFLYDPMGGDIYGLTGYAPRIAGEKIDGYRAGSDMRDFNIYFVEGSEYAPKTFIQCSNNTHAAARCSHMFTLTPKMNVSVKVGYRKSLLPHWREIQKGVSDLIYGFDIQNSSSKHVKLSGDAARL